MTKHDDIPVEEYEDIPLPIKGDLWDLGRNGICICLTADEEARKITWFDISRTRYKEQYFRVFRGFVKEGWATKQ